MKLLKVLSVAVRRTFPMLILLCFLQGCNTILEYPEDGDGVDPTYIRLRLQLKTDPSISLYSATSSDTKASSDPGDYNARWVVELYRKSSDGSIGELVERRVLTSTPTSEEGFLESAEAIETEFSVHALQYTVVAWMDYTDKGSTDDKFYDLSGGLSKIAVPEPGEYIGDCDAKDCYRQILDIDLEKYADRWGLTVNRTITLQRPMAKIALITTDVEKFLEKLSDLMAERLKQQNEGEETQSEKNAYTRQDLIEDLESMRIRVNYSGYFPCGYNALTKKPNEARTDMFFDCGVTLLESGGEARVASDYVFVNGEESEVVVSLTVSDKDGNLLNTVEGIKVPIVRGQLTEIRDEFLTKSAGSGIGIDPGFDGEYNVVLP